MPKRTSKQKPNQVSRRNPGAGPRRLDWNTILTVVVAVLGLVGALGGGLISNWYSFFPRNLPSVESCDASLVSTPSNQKYSGVFAGVVEDADSQADVQLRLSRNGNAVEGSYFREGVEKFSEK